MGHSAERTAVMAYTHLNKLRQLFAEAVRSEWSRLVEAINCRLGA
jgi:hypothetical protein